MVVIDWLSLFADALLDICICAIADGVTELWFFGVTMVLWIPINFQLRFFTY